MRPPENRTIYMPHGKEHVVPYAPTPIIKHTKTLEPTFESEIERMQQLAALHKETEIWQDRALIEVQSNRPLFPIMPLSDLHLGHIGVDYEALKRRLDFAQEYDVKILLLGDLIDGFVPGGKFASGMIDQAPIKMQMEAAMQMLQKYKDIILCSVSTPHHDGWTYSLTGIDLSEYMAKGLDIPLVESGGSLSIAINEVDPYELAVFHKIGNYNSSLNLTNASKRVIDKHGSYDPDIVLSGHVHKAATEQTTIRGKKRGLVVCGTLKGGDKWGKRQGYVGGVDVDKFPVIFLRTDRHDFTIIDDMAQAAEFLDAVNLLYAK